MRVSVDRKLCRKCGLCAAVCPEIFEMGDDHISRVKHMEVPPVDDLQEYCLYASQDCPAKAIHVENAPALTHADAPSQSAEPEKTPEPSPPALEPASLDMEIYQHVDTP